MSELSTKNLNEIETITTLGENDKILVESNGRMKKIAGSVAGGGGIYILDLLQFEESGGAPK